MDTRRLYCKHEPIASIQETLDEITFGPQWKEPEYTTRCCKCKQVINVSWKRADVTIVSLPAMEHRVVLEIKAKISPTVGFFTLPLTTYTEEVVR